MAGLATLAHAALLRSLDHLPPLHSPRPAGFSIEKRKPCRMKSPHQRDGPHGVRRLDSPDQAAWMQLSGGEVSLPVSPRRTKPVQSPQPCRLSFCAPPLPIRDCRARASHLASIPGSLGGMSRRGTPRSRNWIKLESSQVSSSPGKPPPFSAARGVPEPKEPRLARRVNRLIESARTWATSLRTRVVGRQTRHAPPSASLLRAT